MPDNTPNIPNQGSQAFAHMYNDLRAIAGSMCNSPGASATLQPTALVNEVYLKLAKSLDATTQMDDDHLLATAALAMRQVFADHARSLNTQKRGDGWQRVTISNVQQPDEPELAFDLLQLEELLTELGNYDQRQLKVVELRFFGAMTYDQIARVLNITPKRVELDWRMARAWLAVKLKESQADE